MRNWKPVDWIVCGIALSICAVVVLVPLMSTVLGLDENETRTKAIVSLLAGMNSVVSMYVGAAIQAKRDRDDG